MKNMCEYQVKCYMSEDERESVKKYAKCCDKIESAYVRESASDFCVLIYDHKVVMEHTNELTYMRNAINNLYLFIRKTGKYVPNDFEYMFNKIDEIYKTEKDFNNLVLYDYTKKKRIIKRETRRVVRDFLYKKKGD